MTIEQMIKRASERRRPLIGMTAGFLMFTAVISFAEGTRSLPKAVEPAKVEREGKSGLDRVETKPTVATRNTTNDFSTMPPTPQSGGGFNITSSVIAGGGGSSSNGGFTLDGTAGQAAAGTTMSNGP